LTERVHCACGCGQPADGRSRYRQDHFAVLSAARRRLREARRYAYRRGIDFSLALGHVHALVAEAWPAGEGLALRRLDRRLGFVPGNVALTPATGGRRRELGGARLRRRLERLVARTDVAGGLSVVHLLQQYEAQRGLCALTGRALLASSRLDDPDGIALLRPDVSRGVSQTNVALVVRVAAQVAERWGIEALDRLAHDVMATRRKSQVSYRGNSEGRRSSKG
jgi:hypothetical protein